MELEHLPGGICAFTLCTQQAGVGGSFELWREHSETSAQTNNNNKLCPASSVISKIRKKKIPEVGSML